MLFKKLFLFFIEKRKILNIENLFSKKVDSILVRPLGNAIGDAVVHTAHLQQLRYLFPNAKLGVVVTPQNKEVFKHSGLVDTYVNRSIISYILNFKKWDLLIDFENNFNSSSLFMDRIINPKYIAIFRKYNKKHYNFDTVKNYDFHFPQKENERLSHYLIKSGLNRNNCLSETYSKLTTNPINDEKVSRYWKKDKLKILLCPQGSKLQIPENELAEFLNNSIPAPLLDKIDIIVGYTNTANEYTLRLRNLVPNIEINLSPKTTLSEYISLISSADFVIAVDGGSLHIACAFQKPLLSFFAKSQPNMGTWEPLLAPTIPHLCVITNDDVGSNSNLTENFDLVPAIAWFNHYLKNKYNRDYK